jgi:hypothetical protein
MNQDLPPLTTKADDRAPLPPLSREMMLFGISLVYGYLDRIETAKSQEQFDTALALVRSQIKGIADQLSTKPTQPAQPAPVNQQPESINGKTRTDLLHGRERELSDRVTDPVVQVAAHPLQKLYYELLFAVARMHPNETRHQTALRYIRQAESSGEDSCEAAHGNTKGGE